MNTLNDCPKVVLLLANLQWFGKRSWTYIPYTALILTALLKEEFNFAIVDANAEDMSEADVVRKLREVDPDVVLLTGLSTEYVQCYRAASRLAKTAGPSCVTVFGGIFPTLLSEEALKDENIDDIFVGHAEERIQEFLRLILEAETVRALPGIGYRDGDGQPVVNHLHSSISNVRQLVKPDYSLIDVDAYLGQHSTDYNVNAASGPAAVLLTSFGCPYNCMFCAARTVSGRGVAFRPIGDVLEEIE